MTKTRSGDALDVRRRKLRFRSWHRGTREMDLILGRFADARLGQMTDAELDDFERMIEVPDPELMAWIIGERDAPASCDHAVFRQLRDFHLGPRGA